MGGADGGEVCAEWRLGRRGVRGQGEEKCVGVVRNAREGRVLEKCARREGGVRGHGRRGLRGVL